MKINGVISGSKLKNFEKVLGEISSLGLITSEQLRENWQTRRAVERDLQVLIEIMVDICQRLLSLNELTPSATSAELIEKCQELGILSANEHYRLMVQFRNLIVHRYDFVDIGFLADIVNKHLNDFEIFKKDILKYVSGKSGNS